MEAKLTVQVLTKIHWLPFGVYESIGEVGQFRLFWLIPVYRRVGSCFQLLGITFRNEAIQ